MARVVVGTFLLLLAAARPSAAQDDFGYEPRYQDPGPPPAALAIGCVCSLLISGAFGFAGYSMGKSKGLGTPGSSGSSGSSSSPSWKAIRARFSAGA